MQPIMAVYTLCTNIICHTPKATPDTIMANQGFFVTLSSELNISSLKSISSTIGPTIDIESKDQIYAPDSRSSYTPEKYSLFFAIKGITTKNLSTISNHRPAIP